MERLARRMPVAVVLVALVAVPAASSARGIAFQRVGIGTDWGASDGVRYAMFPAKRREVVIDTRDPKLAVRRLPLERCSDRSLPWNYVLGGGQIVGQCPYELMLQSIASGRYGPPPYIAGPGGFFDSFPDGSGGDEVHATAIGSKWIEADVSLENGGAVRYLDWHTGESMDAPASPQMTADVNSPRLYRPLCSPLARASKPVPADGFYPIYYDGRRSVGVRVGGPAPGQGTGEEVAVQPCGAAAPQVVALCHGPCRDFQYGGGVLTWSTYDSRGRGSLYAYSLRGRRVYRWPFTRFSRGRDPFARIEHAGRRVFVTSCHGFPHTRCPVWSAFFPR